MKDDLENIKNIALADIKNIKDLIKLEQIKAKYLGKSGFISAEMAKLAALNIEERKKLGQVTNKIKEELNEAIEQKKIELQDLYLQEKLNSQKIDITLPARERKIGSVHPITQVTEELVSIMSAMGFKTILGPEIEDEYHNFTALNIPDNHPARQMHDTFYLANNLLLRTHTSNVQIRALKEAKPPLRIISFGKVYRNESDMTHTPMFHQFEGLLIEENVNMSHLKACVIELLKKFFGFDEMPVRFRPSFFPFTEPSAEVDIGYGLSGNQIKIGEGNKWMEVLGCGMIHPAVLNNLGIDRNKYTGFAFGMGLDRMAMLKYGIRDLRTFFEGDLRWHKHYGFEAFNVPNLVAGF